MKIQSLRLGSLYRVELVSLNVWIVLKLILRFTSNKYLMCVLFCSLVKRGHAWEKFWKPCRTIHVQPLPASGAHRHPVARDRITAGFAPLFREPVLGVCQISLIFLFGGHLL